MISIGIHFERPRRAEDFDDSGVGFSAGETPVPRWERMAKGRNVEEAKWGASWGEESEDG